MMEQKRFFFLQKNISMIGDTADSKLALKILRELWKNGHIEQSIYEQYKTKLFDMLFEDMIESSILSSPTTAARSPGLANHNQAATPQYLPTEDEHPRVEWLQQSEDFVLNLYKEEEILGSGIEGVVFRGIHATTKGAFAVKRIDKSSLNETTKGYIMNQVQVLGSVRHAHIVRLYEAFETPENYYLVMEHLGGGDLLERIIESEDGHYTEQDACRVIRQCLLGLELLHRNKFIHRDIKADNLILCDPKSLTDVKIADFGFAAHCTETMHAVLGTPGYIAPEVLKNDGYSFPADMWSVGVMLYVILTGYEPFGADTDSECHKLSMAGLYDKNPLIQSQCSESAVNLVESLLRMDPNQRLTASQALQHSWIQGNTSKVALNRTKAELKSMIARRRFKRAVHAVSAIRRFRALSNA